MMSRKSLWIAAGLAVMAGLGSGNAHATPIAGGPVDSSVFTAADLTLSGWSYDGSSVSASTFSGSATGTLELSLANYNDTFGYSKTNYTGMTQVFGSNQADDTTAMINPIYSPYLLYFSTGGGSGNPSDTPATLFSNGHSNGTDSGQAALAIYYNAGLDEYALFFDDGGPAGQTCTGGVFNKKCNPNDDNDFNDMVVTYKPSSTTSVPEPASLALLGAGLFGLGAIRRRKNVSPA